MNLHTMPVKLEEVMHQKKVQGDQLAEKLESLLPAVPTVEISYDINLTQDEQINLAKLGLYLLKYDDMYYRRNYDNSESPI